MTKLVNGNGEKDVTNDMRRVVSGKTDSLNNDSHNKHLDICLFFIGFTQRNSWLKDPVSPLFLLVILSVAQCYDCCKALSASGLCNAFDMGDFFFLLCGCNL